MIYNAALYCRLSKDDESGTESSSITTQKEMLKRYADEQNLNVYDFYIDDGYSGTNFERPDFVRMKNDIESGKVNMVIIKDLSRLGRNYIVSGQLLEEYFPLHKIRCIAVSDGYDSNSEYNDIAPFKNVVNELYARDISKKIKSAFTTKMKSGKYIGNFAPYGYIKSLDDKNKLVINSETVDIVKEIFKMAADGKRPIDIANILNSRRVPSPAVYRCQIHPNLNIENYTKLQEWTSASIQKMLKNMVYIGNTAQHKTSKISFKSHVTIRNSKSDWIIVENTHEPIIDKDTFELVGHIVSARRNAPKSDFRNVFSGIAKCGDCGANMSTTGTKKNGSRYNLVCGKYKLYGSKECTNHFIDYDELCSIVLKKINMYLKFTNEQKKRIIKELSDSKSKPYTTKKETKIKQLKKRKNDISRILKGYYEDKYLGKISEEFFCENTKNYENEINKIDTDLRVLNSVNNLIESDHYKVFFDLINDMTELTELTPEIVHSLIDKIIVYENQHNIDEAGHKQIRHHIKIFFKFIGEVA